jgi:hypothetical protein
LRRWLVGDTSRGRSWTAPWYHWFLGIRAVESYEIANDANALDADFLEASYESGCVTIGGNVPRLGRGPSLTSGDRGGASASTQT